MRQPRYNLTNLAPFYFVRMNNKLKEIGGLLLDNTLFKVENQALGDRNPKWKERWQIVQEFIEEQIHTIFNFKYEPLSFVSMEIGTSSKVPAMPSMV